MSVIQRRSRAPDAAQRLFDGALQSRGPCASTLCGLLGPGSAERHCVPHRVWDTSAVLNRFPRIRHRRREAAVDRERLAIDIRRFVAGQKQTHRRELVWLAGALERVELADLVLGAALLGAVED